MPEEDWKSMIKVNAAVKEAYNKMTQKQEDEVAKEMMKDKKRYEKEREEFNEKGFYTMKDGSKSIDNIKSKKQKEEESHEDESGKKSGPKKGKS